MTTTDISIYEAETGSAILVEPLKSQDLIIVVVSR